MSNFLAIATVTEALRQFILRSLSPEIGLPVLVQAQRPPTEPPAEATITVFCYQVAPDPHLRNLDAPTRAADGTLLTKPQAALDLHYLISFYGDEAQLVPQRMLGVVVRSLYEQPTLQAADIQTAAAQAFLLGSDLNAAPERVRFTPTHMDIDDLYKLWTMMSQTQMALSLTYQATLVLIDGRSPRRQAGRSSPAPSARCPAGGRRSSNCSPSHPVMSLRLTARSGSATRWLSRASGSPRRGCGSGSQARTFASTPARRTRRSATTSSRFRCLTRCRPASTRSRCCKTSRPTRRPPWSRCWSQT